MLESPSAFGASYAAESDRPLAHWEGLATSWSDGDGGALFVADTDEAWVGMAGGARRVDHLAFVAPPGTVSLGWMWVAPEARGGGLGRRLTDEVVAWARSTGARQVDLWVRCDNGPALSLYRGAGFSAVGEHSPLTSDPNYEVERMVLTIDTSPT